MIFVKSQPHFDVHRQYLDVPLIDLQARVLRFRSRIFHCFVDFLENLARLSSSFIFKKLSTHDFLLSESFENKRFELDFSIFQKACFYGQTPLGR